MIRITLTTSINSIRENPFWFLMNSPQAEITVRGRGQQKLGPTSFFKRGRRHTASVMLLQTTSTRKAILLWGTREEAEQELRAYRGAEEGPEFVCPMLKITFHDHDNDEFVGAFTICAIERLHTTRELALLRY
jgi:hypothetical protein